MNDEGVSPTTLVVILIAIAIAVVFIAVLVEMPEVGFTMGMETPRPTLPLITVTCEVFLPIIEKHGPTPQVTPRPTLEGK